MHTYIHIYMMFFNYHFTINTDCPHSKSAQTGGKKIAHQNRQFIFILIL